MEKNTNKCPACSSTDIRPATPESALLTMHHRLYKCDKCGSFFNVETVNSTPFVPDPEIWNEEPSQEDEDEYPF